MNFPERAVALEWVGRTIVDRHGLEIGSCTDVFLDDATAVTEWVRAEVAGAPVFLPAVGAVESGGNVQVVVSRADIASAPPVGGPEHISDGEEVALYQHYGIPYSRDASATVLPTGDTDPSAQDVASGAVDPQGSVTLPVAGPITAVPVPEPVIVQVAAVNPDAAGPTAVRMVGTDPVAAEPAATPPAAGTQQPVPDAGQDRSPGSAPPTGGRGRTGPALAGLAAVAVTAGVVYRARRLRRRRAPIQVERLADRGRAASAALGARIGPVAASAAQYLEAARQVVRRGAGVDEVSAEVPAGRRSK